MLFNPFLLVNFLNFFKSGFYIDFLLKKLAEIFVKNIFIYSSLFFGEKFIIEFFTKKIVDNIIIFLNKTNTLSFSYNFFFISFFFLVFYSIFFFEFFIFFL